MTITEHVIQHQILSVFSNPIYTSLSGVVSASTSITLPTPASGYAAVFDVNINPDAPEYTNIVITVTPQ